MPHPTYTQSGKPVLVGDLIYIDSEVYQVKSMSQGAVGILISAVSLESDKTICTDDVYEISPVPDDIARTYLHLNETKDWNQAFDLAERVCANICGITALSPLNEYPSDEDVAFALVPMDINIDEIAPWAATPVPEKGPRTVILRRVRKDYPSPSRLRRFVKTLISKASPEDVRDDPSLWLVMPNSDPYAWKKTYLDDVCDKLEDTYLDYEIEPMTMAPHFAAMASLFAQVHPDAEEGSPEAKSCTWWSDYADMLSEHKA